MLDKGEPARDAETQGREGGRLPDAYRNIPTPTILVVLEHQALL